jgi:hypothetical protein
MFRNRIINGDMRINQRGATTVTVGTGGANPYIVDRWMLESSITTGGLSLTQQTLTSNDLPFQQGIRNSLRVTASTNNTSFNYIGPHQRIEGNNIIDLNWGTPAGVPVTLSGWIKTNLATNSIVTVSIRNGAINYTYPVNLTVESSGAWQYFRVSIPAPPNNSVWASDQTLGTSIFIGGYDNGGVGIANQWNANSFYRTTSTTNWPATSGNYIEFTGIQFEKGTVATPFEFRPYAIELLLCQRYYEKSYDITVVPGTPTTTQGACHYRLIVGFNTSSTNVLCYPGMISYKVTKRAAPTVTIYASSSGNSGKWHIDTAAAVNGTSTVTGDVTCYVDNNSTCWGFFTYTYNIGTLITGQGIWFQWVASAEL